MDIGKYIKELLILHDCVILPGLGGFVANYKSAEINERLKMISPPSKSILFNRNIFHNDGLLFGHISGKTGMGYKDVESWVQGYIEKIIKATGSGNKFVIDELGFFFQDKEKKLQFFAEPGMNFLIESYGFHDIHIQNFYADFDKGTKSRVYMAGEDSAVNEGKTIRRIFYTGIAATLLMALIFIPVRIGNLDYSAMRVITRTEIPAVENNQFAGVEFQEAEAEFQATEIKAPEFHIITGSFREFSNARYMMKKMEEQGYNARVLSSENQFFRVSAGSYSTREDAIIALSEIRDLPGMDKAWLLKE
jgi:hypothetical protein